MAPQMSQMLSIPKNQPFFMSKKYHFGLLSKCSRASGEKDNLLGMSAMFTKNVLEFLYPENQAFFMSKKCHFGLLSKCSRATGETDI